MSRHDLETLPLSLRRSLQPSTTPSLWALILLLAILSMLLHGRGLGAIPFLGQEAASTRLALSLSTHRISVSWFGSLLTSQFVSFPDSPPLFQCLLTLLHRIIDRNLAGRWLSVSLGALLLPLSMLVWVNLGRLLRDNTTSDLPTPAPSTIGLTSALLVLVCPYLAMAQRLATPDSLFLAESMAIAWLSLRLGIALFDDLPTPAMLRRAISLGITLALALLTVGARAWPLILLPAGAILAARWRAKQSTGPTPPLSRSLAALALSIALASIPWLLCLFAQHRLAPQGSLLPVSATPAFSTSSVLANLQTLFIPSDKHGLAYHPILDRGWYFVYLTPPAFLLALLALPWLWGRRERGVALFLALWAAAAIGPLLFVSPGTLSLSGAPGALPLLMAAGFMLIDLIFTIAANSSPNPFVRTIRWSFCLLIALGSLGWPAFASQRLTLSARPPIAISADLSALFSDPSSGIATRSAYAFLLDQSLDQPIVILLPPFSGNPADGLWLQLRSFLRSAPQYQSRIAIHDLARLDDLPPTRDAGFQILTEKYLSPATATLQIPPGQRLLLILPDPLIISGHRVDPTQFVGARGELIGVFANGNDGAGYPSDSFIRIYLLLNP